MRAAATFLVAVFFTATFFVAAFFAATFFVAALRAVGAAFLTDVARSAFLMPAFLVAVRRAGDFSAGEAASDFAFDVRRAFGSLAEFSGRHERPPSASSVSAEAGPALPDA